MGLYLGNVGNIELTRKSIEGSKESVINPADVNTGRNRFSFDFDSGLLISGDLVELTTTDGTDLDFVAAAGWTNNTVQTSGNWYVSVDDLGGIKLYTSFDAALEGGSLGLVPLTAINRDIPIHVTVRDRDTRLLASVIDYELNTNRETVDITTLSDEHRQQYSSLITGSGRLTAQWDYKNNGETELVHYLMQLVLRTEIGSAFHGKFYIKYPATISQGGEFTATQLDDSLWWEFDAIVTASAVSFSADSLVTGTIDFVATGAIQLKAQTLPKRYLLQEDTGKIELEQDSTAYVLLEERE